MTASAPTCSISLSAIRLTSAVLVVAALGVSEPVLANSLNPTGGHGGDDGYSGFAGAPANSSGGGAGGTGGTNGVGPGGNGGAGGAHGTAIGGTYTSDLSGADGLTGNSGSEGGAGGGGGGGGYGAWLSDLATGTTTFVGIDVTGGAGGAGGEGSGEGQGGNGGDGGIGVFASNGTLVNSGMIIGGNGGVAGASDAGWGVPGQGAVGISGENITITNRGTIAGGFTGGHIGDEAYRAAAVVFTGGSNTLELQTGSTIQGAIEFGGGAHATIKVNDNGLSIGATRLGDSTSALTVDTLDATTFNITGIISGTGSLTKTGNGALILTGTNTYTGDTSINAGRFAVNGSIVGAVTVNSGATLGGAGTVGNTAVDAGGTLAPGNSIGTLKVAGDLTFNAGSVYEVEVDPTGTASDLTHVTGIAHLAGSVAHGGEDGDYVPFKRYTILTADGGLDGRFDSARSNYAFLDASLSYTANDVLLQLQRNDVRFASMAQSGNQQATANGLDSLPQGNALYDRIVLLDATEAAQAYDALSGEMHASTTSALYDVGSTASSLPLNQLRANLNAGLLPGAPLALAGDAPIPAAALPQSAASPLWAEATGRWQQLDGNGNAASVDHSSGGIFIGGDRALENEWRVGGAFGYTDSRIDVDARSSHTDANSYSLALYGGKSFVQEHGRLNLLLGTAYTWHDIDSQRDIDVASLDQRLTAGYHAYNTQFFGELGYALPLNSRVSVEPFAGMAWSELRTDHFHESGGTAALKADSARNHVASTTLGVRTRSKFELGKRKGSLRGTLGWRHAEGDISPKSTLAFDGGQSFTVAGAPIARDTALVELGATVALWRNAAVGVSYSGQFGNGNRENAGSINLRWRF